MKIVDASVGFKMLVPEDDSDRALTLLGENLHAPDFYPVEVTSAVRIAETRKRIIDALTLLGDFLIYLPTLHSCLPLLPRAMEIEI